MEKSNLVVLRDSKSTHFDLITYPDGQQNIKLNLEKLNIKYPIRIKCSIKNFRELEVLLCLVEALNRSDFAIYQIDFIYLFGLRSDRAFEPGMPNYAKDVLIPIIHKLKCNRIEILHPHSLTPLISEKFNPYIHETTNNLITNGAYVIIGGDETAKISSPVEFPGFKKKRYNDTGMSLSITQEIINQIENNPGCEILIFDDLCDGGATFIAGSKILKELYPDRKINLYITHGLFSKGIGRLLDNFDHIYCTNSYQDIEHSKVTQFKVI